MKYLFAQWPKLEGVLLKKTVALFLDYDGTLTSIAKTPDKAVLAGGIRDLLRSLIKSPKFRIAVISGRALEDIKKKLRIDNIIYAGNHGLEIEGPQIKFTSRVSAGYRKLLGQIKNELKSRVSSIQGVLIEDKGLALSVHYRLVAEKQVPAFETALREATIIYAVKDRIRVKPGKKVFEIRPPVEWDKGKTVLWLLARWKFKLGGKDMIPIYIGDDITDEDAFKALKNKGITIFVGSPKESDVTYYLKNTGEVKEFLRRLLRLPEADKPWQN